MKRFAMESLVRWKENARRKPLLIDGARQVGKSWLVDEFAATHYENEAKVVFQNSEDAKAIFDGDLKPERLIRALEVLTGETIRPQTTLIFLDEIQDCPRALMSLKFFCEQAPQYHVAAAGSLLGVALHENVSYPVGKVDHLDLYPMSFGEFLIANGKEGLWDLIADADFDLITPLSGRLTELLRFYYCVGGMPAAVQSFIDDEGLSEVRRIQEGILRDYDFDFSKHASAAVTEKIRLVWQSLPGQLARENKKFMYGAVRPSARAREYETAIKWIVDAGLAYKVPRVSRPGLPLSGYEDRNAFKLYLLDIGLLGAMSKLPTKVLLEGNTLFTEFKGALTEQYVCQQLIAECGMTPYYWSAERSIAEVDFIVQVGKDVIPVEVKAAENLRSKSLAAFCERYEVKNAVRLSLSSYRKEEWLVNIPLYAVGALRD